MTSCVGKVRFRTGDDARRRLAEIRVGAAPGAHIPVRAYLCAMCLRWHLTSESAASRRHRNTWRAKRDAGSRDW